MINVPTTGNSYINQYKNPAANFIKPNAASSVSEPLQPKKTKLSIFYINDMHGNVDNMKGMIAASDKFDKETKNSDSDAIKISAGDNFSGGDEAKNQMVINILSRMGIDVSAVGNHEFDSTLTSFYKYLHPDKTQFLAANAETPPNSEFYNNVQKSTVLEINGNKYGVIGLLPFDLETVTGADDKKMEGVRPQTKEKSIQTVNEEVKKLNNLGIDKIILVSHIGNDNDKEIAPMLHGVDVIVGGHSHTEINGIEENENLFKNADGDPILIVQTGENAKNAGVLNVEFDENGVAVSAKNDLIALNQEKSPAIDYIKDASLGKSPKIGTITECDPLPANRRTTPCAWTNFLCDAMKSETGSEIAFINAANARKTPKQGKLTERDVSESTPLKNTLIVKKMTEKEVVRALKEALKATYSNETGEPGILHVSGLSYQGDTNGNLKELNFIDENGNKTPIDINNPGDRVYKVCYDSFLAKGTEYPVFVPETMTYPEIEQSFDFDKDKTAIDYINKLPNKENLIIKDDGRIKILDENNTSNKSNQNLQKNNPLELNYSPLLVSAIQNLHSNSAIDGYAKIG